MKEIDIIAVKKIQLDILYEIHKFCINNSLKYSLCGGTLIGAVRHKGYIPWDDDIDITMLRPDYEFLIKYFNKECDVKYALHCLETDKEYAYPYAKVSNENTLINENLNHPLLGINVDIFPVDGLPEGTEETERHFRKIGFYRKIFLLKLVKPKKKFSVVKKAALILVQTFLMIISKRYLACKISRIAKKYDIENSAFAACSVWGYGMKEINRRAVFDENQSIKFEGNEFMVMGGFDEYLRNIYGDYMQLPPIDKRVSPHIIISAKINQMTKPNSNSDKR